MKEIQLFSLLDVMIEEQTRYDIVKILKRGSISGLPHLLAYKTSNNCCEIMMT